MPTETINVKFVNPPKEGKKNASIKTDDDKFFLLPSEMMSQVTAGGRYTVEYRSNVFKGTTYHYIDKVEIAVPAPSAVAKHQAGKYGAVDMQTAERIFVCGAMNAMLGNVNTLPFSLLPRELIDRVNILRETWRATLGNPQQDGDMNDEIPY